jgi:hypothetical protein
MVNGFIALGLNELNLHQMFFSCVLIFYFRVKTVVLKMTTGMYFKSFLQYNAIS